MSTIGQIFFPSALALGPGDLLTFSIINLGLLNIQRGVFSVLTLQTQFQP